MLCTFSKGCVYSTGTGT